MKKYIYVAADGNWGSADGLLMGEVSNDEAERMANMGEAERYDFTLKNIDLGFRIPNAIWSATLTQGMVDLAGLDYREIEGLLDALSDAVAAVCEDYGVTGDEA